MIARNSKLDNCIAGYVCLSLFVILTTKVTKVFNFLSCSFWSVLILSYIFGRTKQKYNLGISSWQLYMGSLNYWIRLICFCFFDSHSAELHFSHLHLQVAGWHMKEVEWKRQVKEWHERINEFEKRESELNERLYHLEEVGLIHIHGVISIF